MLGRYRRDSGITIMTVPDLPGIEAGEPGPFAAGRPGRRMETASDPEGDPESHFRLAGHLNSKPASDTVRSF